MPKTELLIKLRDLHEELSAINVDLKSAEHVDDKAIDALGQLVTDACELVDRAKLAKEAETDLAERHDLLDRIMQFETNHRRVTKFLSQITDVLAMMGI